MELKLNFKDIIKTILSEQVVNPLLTQLKEKYVGEGKLFSEDEFKKVEDVTGNKWYLIAWLTKKVATNLIKKEDIYKWKDYFPVFEKNKKKFKFQDLNLYKTPEDLRDLIENIIQVMEKDIEMADVTGSPHFLSRNEIDKLIDANKNQFLGVWKPTKTKAATPPEGYQVFEISEVSKDNWKIYRDLLGRCKGRDKGARIEICTIGQYSYFKQYLRDPKGSKYIVLFNLSDSLSPYQLHLESNQFMNKNDVERFNFSQDEFIDWLGKNSPTYTPQKIVIAKGGELPLENEGSTDEKGKQGKWVSYEDGIPTQITTYVNDKQNGPFIEFHEGSKKIRVKGNLLRDRLVGQYEVFSRKGNIIEKGLFADQGVKIGLWRYTPHYSFADVSYFEEIEDEPSLVTAYTQNDKIKFISDGINPYTAVPKGRVVFYHPSGTIRAYGKFTPSTGKVTGDWVYFNPDQSIRAEGKMRSGEMVGIWDIVVDIEKYGKKTILQLDTDKEEVKIYNSQGEFIEKKKLTDKLAKRLEKVVNIK